MAKTRKFTEKNKAIAVTKEVKATTPTKTVKGKVVKNKKRVNVKRLTESGEEHLILSSIVNQDSVRAFSIRVERITADSNSNRIKTVSQALCKTKEKISPLKQDCQTKIRQQNSNQYSTRSRKVSSNISFDSSAKNVEHSNLKQSLFGKNKLQCQTGRQVQNQGSEDYKSPLNVRSLVKLRKAPSCEKETVVGATATLYPCSERKCVVRLKKIPNAKALINIPESTIPIKSRKCLVRLENLDYASSNQCFNVPVIDNNKRKYFRKLSLTKSFNKLVDNESPEKNNVNDFEKENQNAYDSKKSTEISELIPALTETNQQYSRKVLSKNNQTNIKQIAKLSLKGPISKLNKVTANKLKHCQGEQLESSIVFNPVRNSTILDCNSTKNKQQEKSNEETKQASYSKDKSSSQNYANKSDEIENLLNSLDDEEEILMSSLGKSNENICQIAKTLTKSNDKNKTNKFFHHKIENATAKENSKTPAVAKNRRLSTKRSTNIKRNNIYDFFSQSQTSDSDIAKHVDPTADIVKKLIREGKAQVATNCKGKGKLKLKPRKRPVKQMKKIKQIAERKFIQLKNKTKKVAFIENQNVPNAIQEDHFDVDHSDMDHFQNDHFDDNEHLIGIGGEMEKQKISNNLNANDSKNLTNEQEGTFSCLARKVLINQAGRSNFQRKTQSELLKAVRSIISTPVNKKTILPHCALQTDLSPIVMAPQQQASSPWRVNEDAFLPKTFNFHRSSGNLPSFSSDFIPSTPRKRKPKICLNDKDPKITASEKASTKNMSNTSVIQSSPAVSIGNPQIPILNEPSVISSSFNRSPRAGSIENMHPQMPNLNEPSAISSFSSNDSNVENMPPPKRTPENQNENDRIFDTKQLPNPRRALKYRSPLKTINILEVVHLPTYKHPDKHLHPDDMATKQIEMFGFEENLDESFKEKSNSSLSTRQLKEPTGEDLFGFEDYLSQTEVSSQENAAAGDDERANEANQTIHDKLQSLKKLKPVENDLQKNDVQNYQHAIKHMPIFDDVNSKRSDMRQRGIQEMLCSTMLDARPSTSTAALKQLRNDKFRNTERPNIVECVNQSVLFTDPEPETTFNESEAHRTYVRPNKRKRRIKENNFVMFLESDESDDDDNSAEKHKHSRESENSSLEMVSKKKRQRKEPHQNLAMMEFVKEFNELCKEVETYELVKEKSA